MFVIFIFFMVIIIIIIFFIIILLLKDCLNNEQFTASDRMSQLTDV